MRVATVRPDGPATWAAGLVGQWSERLRRIIPAAADISTLTITTSASSYDGDGQPPWSSRRAHSIDVFDAEPSVGRLDPFQLSLDAFQYAGSIFRPFRRNRNDLLV